MLQIIIDDEDIESKNAWSKDMGDYCNEGFKIKKCINLPKRFVSFVSY